MWGPRSLREEKNQCTETHILCCDPEGICFWFKQAGQGAETARRNLSRQQWLSYSTRTLKLKFSVPNQLGIWGASSPSCGVRGLLCKFHQPGGMNLSLGFLRGRYPLRQPRPSGVMLERLHCKKSVNPKLTMSFKVGNPKLTLVATDWRENKINHTFHIRWGGSVSAPTVVKSQLFTKTLYNYFY